MRILVPSGVNECRPAHGNVTPWHYSCSVFPFCSVFISTSLLMLFQVFYLYSITTKVYSSPETAGLAPCYVFLLSIAYTTHSTISSPLFPPSVMCFRLFLKSHSGTAGRQSSLVIHGADFSTKDMDNDNCMCKCALMLTGGEWSLIRFNLCWGTTRGTSRAFPTPQLTIFYLGWCDNNNCFISSHLFSHLSWKPTLFSDKEERLKAEVKRWGFSSLLSMSRVGAVWLSTVPEGWGHWKFVKDGDQADAKGPKSLGWALWFEEIWELMRLKRTKERKGPSTEAWEGQSQSVSWLWWRRIPNYWDMSGTMKGRSCWDEISGGGVMLTKLQ